MMTWQSWKPDNTQVVLTGYCTTEIFDQADSIGAYRVMDEDGCVCRKISGEWVWLPSRKGE